MNKKHRYGVGGVFGASGSEQKLAPAAECLLVSFTASLRGFLTSSRLCLWLTRARVCVLSIHFELASRGKRKFERCDL